MDCETCVNDNCNSTEIIDFSQETPISTKTSDIISINNINTHETIINDSQISETKSNHSKDVEELLQIIDHRDRDIQHLKMESEKIQIEYDKMLLHLEQKDNVIHLQKRELDVLDKEKNSIYRDYDRSQKEKEMAVVRQAVAEKNIIDLKQSNEQLNRRLKESQKELDALAVRLKFITNERDRFGKDLRKSVNECDSLKNDLNAIEMKNKWNQVKLKQEMTTKSLLEQKIAELQQQVNQLNDDKKQNLDSIKYEEKVSEAQLILLKHTVDEREKENASLTSKVNQLKCDLNEITTKYEYLTNEHSILLTEKQKQNFQLNETICANDQQAKQIEQLTSQLIESDKKLSDAETLTKSNGDKLIELQQLCDRYSDEHLETNKIRARNEKHLIFIEKLTEKSVNLENKLIIATAKVKALDLENEKLKNVYETNKEFVDKLEKELAQLKTKQIKDVEKFDIELMEQTSLNKDLQNQFENVLGDLDAAKRKHSQVIKELNREIILLREELNPKSKAQLMISRENDDVVKEPSKKSLIDRIVRLQYSLAKQREKNEFLENHCAGLMNKLKFKS